MGSSLESGVTSRQQQRQQQQQFLGCGHQLILKLKLKAFDLYRGL